MARKGGSRKTEEKGETGATGHQRGRNKAQNGSSVQLITHNHNRESPGKGDRATDLAAEEGTKKNRGKCEAGATGHQRE